MTEAAHKLDLKGDATLQTIEGMKREILAALEKAPRVEASIDGVKEFDLTFVQLLLSAQKTAAAKGKTFEVVSLPNIYLVRMAEELGIPRPEGVGDNWPW